MGQHPLDSFAALGRYWSEHPNARRFYFVGNSQMQVVNLAPGEVGAASPEKTYPDLVSDYFQEHAPDTYVVYRLSSGAMSYEEALWYLEYLANSSTLKPDVVFLQINYQALWNAGIRDGMLELLTDASFRSRIEELTAGNDGFADAFAQALSRFDDQRSRVRGADAQPMVRSLAGQPAVAARIEWAFRHAAESIPGFERRLGQQEAFLNTLYRARIYLLRLTPSTSRSISRERVARSQACLRAIAALCRSRGIRLVLFLGPLNPAVPIYRRPDDRRMYRELTGAVAAEYQIAVHDFEGTITAEHWGTVLGVPDPTHIGRAGHRLMADLLIPTIAGTRLQSRSWAR
jgi:hypothetical protein